MARKAVRMSEGDGEERRSPDDFGVRGAVGAAAGLTGAVAPAAPRVHDADGAVFGRPLTPTDDDQHPPPGVWLSWKGAKSYLYDLVVGERRSE
jgi:hypothetical protein